MKKLIQSIWGKILIVGVIVVLAFAVRTMLEGKEETQLTQQEAKESKREVTYAQNVEEDNLIRQVFHKQFPEAEILLACEEDITDDAKKDLVVIYRDGDLTRTVVVTDSGDGITYHFSDPIPAPVENQKIQFKNIDKEAETEIIITGEKKGAVGYAIYRMIDGQPVDLFGEGMEDCC